MTWKTDPGLSAIGLYEHTKREQPSELMPELLNSDPVMMAGLALKNHELGAGTHYEGLLRHGEVMGLSPEKLDYLDQVLAVLGLALNAEIRHRFDPVVCKLCERTARDEENTGDWLWSPTSNQLCCPSCINQKLRS